MIFTRAFFIFVNPKRLALAILTVFIGIFATDFLIHGVWLASTYADTAALWRTPAEMNAHFGWLLLAQLMSAITFVTLYAIGFAPKACVRCAIAFGIFMAFFQQATTLISYAVQPLPGIIALKWFIAGVIQGVVIGLLAFFAYKPKAEQRKSVEAKPETPLPATA